MVCAAGVFAYFARNNERFLLSLLQSLCVLLRGTGRLEPGRHYPPPLSLFSPSISAHLVREGGMPVRSKETYIFLDMSPVGRREDVLWEQFFISEFPWIEPHIRVAWKTRAGPPPPAPSFLSHSDFVSRIWRERAVFYTP